MGLCALLLQPVLAQPNESLSKQQNKRQQEIVPAEISHSTPDTAGLLGLEPEEADAYQLCLENETLMLYIHQQTMGIKVVDKRTQYVWSSDRQFGEDDAINSAWKKRINSGITVEYANAKQNKTEYAMLDDQNHTLTLQQQGEQVIATAEFPKIDVSFEIVFSLSDHRLSVEVPKDRIREGEEFLITNILLFPFLGSTDQNETDGYLVIPDGSGAIMEYGQQKKEIQNPYQAKVYGVDFGMKDANSRAYSLTMPIYGIVNGVNHNAMYAYVNQGSAYATLRVDPAGVTTDYNWATFQFDYRQHFFRQTANDGSGFTDLEQQKQAYDIQLTYSFLHNDDANYTGIAHDYQSTLVSRGVLHKTQRDDPSFVYLQFLGAEIFKRELGFRANVYTTISDLKEITEDLEAQGVVPTVEYQGTLKGGKSEKTDRVFPIERQLGSEAELKDVVSALQDKNIPVFLGASYAYARLDRRGVNKRTEIVQRVDQQLNVFTVDYDRYSIQYGALRKDASLARFEDDLQRFRDLGVNVALDAATGTQLNSDYGSGRNREETVAFAEKMFAQDDASVAYHHPNEYMFATMDLYLDMPMGSSRFLMFTQDIPFVQTVFKGYVDYFAPTLNQSSNAEYDLLKMIEYGAYPSYIVTKQSPQDLANTPSSDIFSSQYDIWKQRIIQTHATVKSTLQQVAHAQIVDHVLEDDLAVTTYDNGVNIYVNYRDTAAQKDGSTIQARSFFVREGNG